ncbi:MAG: sulfite exporter TauE/SafE family protein [Chloroflexi bacterium]|nr:sulfite exporter TauE/SafE family protein [Chloroflexota bacterium]
MIDQSIVWAVLLSIFFFAAFGQAIAGFGFGLVVMPLTTMIFGTKISAPLVALAGLTLYTINLLRYHQSINWREVIRLGSIAALGVPIGIWGLVNLDESIIKFVLGCILIGYAILNLIRPATSFVPSSRWGYLFGFATGCLGGAYNIPGPPLIIYGTLRQWERNEFRAVLQTLFFLTGLLTVFSHYFTHHLTSDILTLYAFTAPALILGIVIGSIIDRRINHTVFRWIILALIFILGLTLIFGGR